MTSGLSLRMAMRRLWADHVFWTRLYIIAAVAATPDASFTADRLLRNQEDIGNAIVPVYGQTAGRRLTELLRQHILIAVDMLEAAKANDTAKFAAADKKWTANADDIAAFLSGANPNWPKKDIADLLYLHLKLTKDEVVARLTKNWVAEPKTFDEIFTEAMLIADTLSDGVIKQHPELFQD